MRSCGAVGVVDSFEWGGDDVALFDEVEHGVGRVRFVSRTRRGVTLCESGSRGTIRPSATSENAGLSWPRGAGANPLKRGQLKLAFSICIDDIGLLPVTTETAEALYRVVDAAYEKRSIALSSNLHPAGSTS